MLISKNLNFSQCPKSESKKTKWRVTSNGKVGRQAKNREGENEGKRKFIPAFDINISEAREKKERRVQKGKKEREKQKKKIYFSKEKKKDFIFPERCKFKNLKFFIV